MPTIEAKNGVVTHINVFTVPREIQQLLIDSLVETVNAARAYRDRYQVHGYRQTQRPSWTAAA